MWQACITGKIDGFVSGVTPINVFYIARKQIGTEQARLLVGDLLTAFQFSPVDSAILLAAYALPIGDFEDAVQAAAARAAGLDAIVTRNGVDFTGARVPVLTPAALLAQLAA